MITGHFDLALKNSGRLCDKDFEEARRQGRLGELLDGLETAQECHTDNLVFDLIVPYLGYFVFSAPSVGDLWRDNATVPAVFANICLLTTDSEPNYQSEWYRSGGYEYQTPSGAGESANGSTGGKLFEEEASEAADIRSDLGGREAIWYRERFLYLPSQGSSTNIRSIGVYWCAIATTTGVYFRQRAARVRLKDSGGNPIIVSKGTDQVLLVEYKATFVSI
jgi:hypothetical protein